jgi:protein tyrosine/serine phosphatase
MHQTFTRTVAAIALLTFSFALPAAAQQGNLQLTSTSAVALNAAARINIKNFGRVSPTYYRGAQPEGSDYAALAALGVKTVINLTSDDAQAGEQQQVEKAGMKYLQIPMDTRRTPTAGELKQFLAVVNDSTSGPVFVHCVGGKHRTGVMTAAYRITSSGWTADQAFKEMKQYKFGADFLHPEFKKFVYTFQPERQPGAQANAALTNSDSASTAAAAAVN